LTALRAAEKSKRKTLKGLVAQAAEKFERAIKDCSVHGDGAFECECEKAAYEYDYVFQELRMTDGDSAKYGRLPKHKKRRKNYHPVHAAPHFVKPELAELADKMYGKATALNHNVEVVWDDECCAAMYCPECDRWGHTMFDYLGDPIGEEVEGVLFEKECGA